MALGSKYTFVLKALLFLFLNTAAVYAVQPTFIKGTIYSTYNNAVITGATISTSTGLTTTAKSGSFLLRVPPNVYDIYVHAPDFRSNLLTGIHAAPGQTAAVDIRLVPSTAESGRVEGRIFESGSQKGVQTAFIATDSGGITTSNANGYFQLFTPSGVATLTIAAQGYSSKIIENVAITPDKPKYILVYLNKSPDTTVDVFGTITNVCTGSKINSARVVSQTGEISLSQDGLYTISSATGLTTLVVSAPGYQYSYYNINLFVVPKSRQIDFQLIPSVNSYGLIRGVITNSITHEPLEDVKLQTDTGGISFSKQNGRYDLYAAFCSSTLSAYKEGFVILQIPLSVPRGLPTALNLSLDPHASIAGVISDGSNNHTISGAEIYLQEQPLFSTASDDFGLYILKDILPDQYTMSVSHRCYQHETRAVSVESGDVLEENFILSPIDTGFIEGIVSDKISGGPIEGARVITDHGAVTKTDYSGFYSMALPACRTFITFEAAGYLSKTGQKVLIEDDQVLVFNSALVPCPFFVSTRNYDITNSIDIDFNVFRKYRDDVLKKTVTPHAYIKSFYRHAGEISTILLHNPNLRQMFREILIRGFQLLNFNDRQDNLKLEQTYLEKISNFLEQFLEETSNPNLRKTVNSILSDIKQGQNFDTLGIVIQ